MNSLVIPVCGSSRAFVGILRDEDSQIQILRREKHFDIRYRQEEWDLPFAWECFHSGYERGMEHANRDI